MPRTSSDRRRRAVVLGAGLQGVCAALALREAGWSVELLDRATTPLDGASTKGEGKIHLGFVYANEPSRRTASLMIDGAMAFASLLDRWVPWAIDWATLRSTPFHYAVLPDSMVPPDRLRAHYEWVAGEIEPRLESGETYLGCRPGAIVDELAVPAVDGVTSELLAAFLTAERAVEMALLRPHLIAALGDASVRLRLGRTVHTVERTPAGFVVEHAGDDSVERTAADIVVNCLWDGRLAVDASMDIHPSRSWVFRLKQSIEGRLSSGAPRPPSITFVLGPYGDIVVRSSGDLYASWYPECIAGWSSDVSPPLAWRALMDGAVDTVTERAHVERIIASFAPLVPAVAGLDDPALHAGVIFAWGDRDIDDHASELHSREAVGVHDHDGYYSVDTGKLTTAPLFAQRLVALL